MREELRRSLLARLGQAPDAGQRVDSYYLPAALWCAGLPASTVVGVQGPQGAGKSTLVEALVAALSDCGVPSVGVSIDDFYLTFEQQRRVAEANPGNPLLEFRGAPGTHDVGLGERTLRALREAGPGPVALPAYDKGAHGGRGDRAPEAAFRRVEGPFSLIFVEGWMLGFTPRPAGEALSPHLAAVDRALGAYASWHRLLGAFVQLRPPSIEAIVGWRVDAERARRRAGLGGLSDEQARDYIERFLPLYRAYLPSLSGPELVAGPCLEVQLDERRGASSVTRLRQ